MSAWGAAPIAGRYSIDGLAIDKAAFYAVACDPSRSVAVEACAGSGKTWLLVSRMVRALLAPVLDGRSDPQGGIEPHQILAITFTRKAAGEMRRRLNELLQMLASSDDATILNELLARGVAGSNAARHLPEIRAACARWLVCGRPVQVRTIHGWFAALLRSAPLTALQELGLPLDYALLEDETQALAQLWPRFFRALLARPGSSEEFSSLVAAHGRQQIRLALEAALRQRLEFGLADRKGNVSRSVRPFAEQFAPFAGLSEPDELLWRAGEWRNALDQAAHHLGRASAPSFARAGAALLASLAAQDRAALVEALFTKDGTPRKFSLKIHGLEQIRRAQNLVQGVLQAREQHVAWRYHQSMAHLTRIMIDEFTALKRERAWVDMPDLERAALYLLGDPVLSGWIQERLDASLRHLLIDEFQDTSPLQWQALFAWLSSYGGASGQTPCLFIVGDPKQSIYRFRGAAPAVFGAAQEFMREVLGGALLSCDHTRRNARAVVEAVNGVLSQAQGSGPLLGFRPHSTESTLSGAVLRLPAVERPPRKGRAADAGDEDAAEAEPGPWRDSLTTPRLLPEEKLRTLECRQAAAWVLERMAQGAPAGAIMVLARQRDRLVVMEDALREVGVACEQPERTELGERCEVQDILSLVDALVSPGHDLSLARAVKSPLFGVSDEDLVTLALQQRERRAATGSGAPSWFDLICDPGQPDARWSRIGEQLRRWKQWIDRLPCHDALVAIYEDGEVMRRFAQVAPPVLRALVLANLHALITASLEMDGGRYVTPYALVRRMRRGGVKAATASAPGAVRLLTIHGAKGLEANHVLVLDCDAPAMARARPGVLLDWPVDQAAPVKFAFLLDDQKAPACCAAEFAAEQAARQREEMNALYVAMTRACQELVLSALQSARPGAATWWTQLAPWTDPVALPLAVNLPTARVAALVEPVRLLTLPEFRMPVVPAADPGPDMPRQGLATARDRQAAILGSAMHRLLELWPLDCTQPTPAMLRRTASEFDLDASTLAIAAAMAIRIVTGAGAWAWDGSRVDWWGNEVDIVDAGKPLRVDRLVRRRDTGYWWVLDYKASGGSLARPQRIEQLSRYRDAVRKAHAGQEVLAAFLGADGGIEPLT